ncbi:unnamed protein product [Chironomus riparius]|uniref:Peptidase S1 domain-containing protein n=1 Tax=Chironomus riparius TaxID=315576 RepID=A0A9N9WN11_9DIPT|nr:unnamed protein product [Chironomus riparius]
MSKIYLVLSVFNVIFVSSNESPLVFSKVETYLGDQCTVSGGIEGKCVKANQCTTIKSYKNITRCEFDKNDLIVCCPGFKEIASSDEKLMRMRDIDEVNTTAYRNYDFKNERFNQILCKNHEPREKFLPNIVNGNEADVAEFPYQVALGYQSTTGSYDFNCGGSLILDDIVITAAHCAHLKEAQPVIVRLGRTSLVESMYDHGPIVDVEIKKIIVHEKSKRVTRENDIALIKLSRKVEFTHYIKPICILDDIDSWNKNLTVTGFGVVDPDTKMRSTWLMKGIVQEEEIEDCRKSYSIVSKTIFDTQICASGKFNTDACQGDSGGPLILHENNQESLYGITSHGNGCGSDLPALYTKVDRFLKWIEQTIFMLDKSDVLQS